MDLDFSGIYSIQGTRPKTVPNLKWLQIMAPNSNLCAAWALEEMVPPDAVEGLEIILDLLDVDCVF